MGVGKELEHLFEYGAGWIACPYIVCLRTWPSKASLAQTFGDVKARALRKV